MIEYTYDDALESYRQRLLAAHLLFISGSPHAGPAYAEAEMFRRACGIEWSTLGEQEAAELPQSALTRLDRLLSFMKSERKPRQDNTDKEKP